MTATVETHAPTRRALVVDDCALERRLLRALIERSSALEVIEACSASELWAHREAVGIDVVLLDDSLPDARPGSLLEELAAEGPPSWSIVSMVSTGTIPRGAVRPDAALSKSGISQSTLSSALERARAWRSRRMERGAASALLPSATGRLVSDLLSAQSREELREAVQRRAFELALEQGLEEPAPRGAVSLGAGQGWLRGPSASTFAEWIALARTRIEETEGATDDLIGAVTHDLRTPIQVMQNAVSFLGPSLNSEDDAQLGRLLERSVGQIGELVEGLHDYARVRGGAELDRVGVDVSRLIEDALAAARLAHPRVRFAPSKPRSEGLRLRLDAARMTRVFQNLLDNAARHGTGEVSVELGESRLLGGPTIAISSSGPPPSAQDLARPFDPFAHSRKTKAGRSYGMSIAKALVEAHGGRLELSTASEGGARLTVHLSSDRPRS